MRRGDLVTVSAPGAYGKPRPAVVLQSDFLTANDSVLVGLLTSTRSATPLYRLTLMPSPTNGLRAPSQIMVDKIVALPRAKCGEVIGRIAAPELASLNRMLTVMLGLAD